MVWVDESVFGEADSETDDDSITSVDLGLRYGSDRLLVGARIFLPLDDNQENVPDLAMIGAGADLGVAASGRRRGSAAGSSEPQRQRRHDRERRSAKQRRLDADADDPAIFVPHCQGAIGAEIRS